MEKTKVISVRLSESLLAKLDEKAAWFRYWKRNAFINQVLENVLEGADDKSIQLLLRHWRLSDKKLKVTVEEIPSSWSLHGCNTKIS